MPKPANKRTAKPAKDRSPKTATVKAAVTQANIIAEDNVIYRTK